MDIELTFYRQKNLSYVVVDNYFSPSETQESLQELKDLKRLSAKGESTGAAKNFEGTFKKTGTGVWLDNVYVDRKNSPILNATRKIFNDKIYGPMVAFDSVFNYIPLSNFDSCLANYYALKQKYDAHEDQSRITAVTLLGEGEFTGGGFSFPDQGVEIEFKQSRTIVFPSCVNHASVPHFSDNAAACRMSIAHFIDFK